jgi:myo-inositol 2-dehydrogenase/D-chiro-inositol 1-dehydrogenase
MGNSGQIAVGVIGTGGMGGMHAEVIQTEVANARLAAVADLDTERAEKVAEKSAASVFTDAEEMIRDENVEAVVVASPDPTHAPLVLECLKNEKPVLCEKPLADSADAALKVVEAEAELGRKLVQVGFMRRYGIDSKWVVINAMIHDIDSARWFIEEEIEEVYVRGKNTAPKLGEDVWDVQLVQFSTTGGRVGSIETNVVSHYGYEVGVEVVCERGIVGTALPAGAIVRQDNAASRRITEGWYDRFRTAYVTEVREWIESVSTGTPTGSDAWDGYASLVVADACIASLRSGSPEKVANLDPPALYSENAEVAK